MSKWQMFLYEIDNLNPIYLFFWIFVFVVVFVFIMVIIGLITKKKVIIVYNGAIFLRAEKEPEKHGTEFCGLFGNIPYVHVYPAVYRLIFKTAEGEKIVFDTEFSTYSRFEKEPNIKFTLKREKIFVFGKCEVESELYLTIED